jgi:hypothetical protein
MASVYLLLCTLYASSVFASALFLQPGETVYRPTHTDSRKRQSTVLSLIAPPTTCGPASPAEQERIDKDCIASLAKEERLYIDWNVRPATIDDANQTAKLLSDSFYTILPQNYDNDTLTKVLPSITAPRQQLLTCGTWYVVVTPSPRILWDVVDGLFVPPPTPLHRTPPPTPPHRTPLHRTPPHRIPSHKTPPHRTPPNRIPSHRTPPLTPLTYLFLNSDTLRRIQDGLVGG